MPKTLFFECVLTCFKAQKYTFSLYVTIYNNFSMRISQATAKKQDGILCKQLNNGNVLKIFVYSFISGVLRCCVELFVQGLGDCKHTSHSAWAEVTKIVSKWRRPHWAFQKTQATGGKSGSEQYKFSTL